MADFIFYQRDGVVFVVDKNLGGRSVTNDAELVVKQIYNRGSARGNIPIVYRDSTGRWDQLDHDGRGKFLRFVLLNAQSEAEIVAALKSE